MSALRPLRDSAPLRTTAVLRAPGPPVAIPHVYGRCFVRAGPYPSSGRLWVIADHAIAELLSTQKADGTSVGGRLINTADSSGHPIALVETAETLTQAPVVEVRGKRHPTTGRLITNPATILWSVLTELGGQDLAESELAEFQHAMTGIELGGSIGNASNTLRSYLDQILISAGAAWSAGRPGLALKLPINSEPIRNYSVLELQDLQLECSQATLSNAVEVLFDYKLDEPRQRLKAEARASVARYGRLEETVECLWTASPARAAAVAESFLNRRARPTWKLAANAPLDRQLLPGDRVNVTHPHAPALNPWLVRDAALDITGHRTRLELEAQSGPVPAVVFV